MTLGVNPQPGAAPGMSPLPVFARACIQARRRHPVLNARFDADRPVLSDGTRCKLAYTRAIAIGRTGSPVLPRSFIGNATSARSVVLLLASSSSHMFSMTGTPASVSR